MKKKNHGYTMSMETKQEWNFNKQLLIHVEQKRALSEYEFRKAISFGTQVITNH